MVKEIAIYIEGGGDDRDVKNNLREAFGMFLGELREIARQKRIRWKLVACGSGQAACQDFCTAVSQSPSTYNVLLVDAESAIVGRNGCLKLPWAHLLARDGWKAPAGVNHTHCFLMVECMETWLSADGEKIQEFYGPRFAPGSLLRQHDIESVSKDDLYHFLKQATRNCSSPYHKTRHAFGILKKARPAVVRSRAPHCKRLFTVLASKMEETFE